MIRDNKKKRLQLLYWFAFLGIGAAFPFSGLYYKNVLTNPDGTPALNLIGIIFFIQPFLGIFASAFAGILADKFRIKEKILFICGVMVFIGISILAVPGFFPLWSVIHKALIIGIGLTVIGIFVGPIIPLLNSETLDYLHDTGKDTRTFGQYRFLGSISYILMAICTGFFLNLTQWIVLPILFYAVGFLCLSIVSFSGVKAKIKKVSIPWHLLKGDKVFKRFLVFGFLQGFALLSSFNLTSYFMDDLKLTFLTIGFSFGISAILEIPLLFKSSEILKKLGTRNMIIWGTAFLGLKTFLLSVVAPLGMIVPVLLVMMLHGVGYSLQFNGFIDFLNKRAHKSLRSTYINIFFVFSMNMASAVGALTSTFIIDHLGSSWMMIINSLIAVGSIFYFVFFVKEGQSEKSVIM